MLVTVLAWYLNWRAIFVLFGLVGFFWAAVWYWWFRDDPSQHAQVNEAERQLIVSGRRPPTSHNVGWDYWRRLVTHRNTWSLCLMYIANVWTYFFCITWFPTYLEKRFYLQGMWLGVAAGLPLAVSVLSDLFGGVATDLVTRRFGLRVGRVGLAPLRTASRVWQCSSQPPAVVRWSASRCSRWRWQPRCSPSARPGQPVSTSAGSTLASSAPR